MPNLPISGLNASAANLASADLLPVVQTSGVGPVKMTGLQLAGGLLGSTALTGATVTTSKPVLDLSQTWNAGAVTFTGLKFNATDTASASGSLLMDLQVGSASKVAVGKNGSVALNGGSLNAGEFNAPTNGGLRFGSGIHGVFPASSSEIDIIANGTTAFYITASKTTILGPTLQLGAADAASPVPQFLQVQGVSAGTSNTAGAAFTIAGSRGTGNAAGGSIIFQVAPAGSSGTAQNALATALTIASDKSATFAGNINLPASGSILANSANYITYNGTTARIWNSGNTSTMDFNATSNIISGSPATITLRPGAGSYDFVVSSSGFFNMNNSYLQMTELTAPTAPSTNQVRIYAEDNGAGKTRLMALFATGAAQQIAIEP